MWGVSLTHPVLPSFLSKEFLLHIPAGLIIYWGSFSYTSHAGFIFIGGVYLTHAVLPSCFFFFCVCVCVFYLRSFSYTYHDGCTFLWGISLTSRAGFVLLLLFLSGEFLLHIACWLRFFFLFWGVSLTHPMLDLLFFGEFLVHIHC